MRHLRLASAYFYSARQCKTEFAAINAGSAAVVDVACAVMCRKPASPKTDYRRMADALSLEAVTNVKRGTFREFQLYMVRWQTRHLA